MKKLIFTLIMIFIIGFSPKDAYAIIDPLSAPNNKFGVHILFTTEISQAARLINSNGGEWGYVTIPIQSYDRDLEKWQKFMDLARQNHVIPIIRIATENYYFDTKFWRKPTEDDVMDFANFLNSLVWPVKNRYVIIFNEVNRGDEWGGSPNPQEYAEILNYAVTIFKSLNGDFFIISAGFDNASINIKEKSINQYDFMIQMNDAVPGIFGQIDGLGSHSYPNPAFSKPPWITTSTSISSFKFERDIALRLSNKKLPVFITETGWSDNKLSKNQISSYFIYAFASIWSDNGIAAVTPFLLQAGTEPFLQFSLLDKNGNYNEISNVIQGIPKIKGEPIINYNTDFSSNSLNSISSFFSKSFPEKEQYGNPVPEKVNAVTAFLKWIFKISS